MYWQDDHDTHRPVVPDDVVDVAFRVNCRCVPVDHAYPLSRAVADALPWFEHEELAGLHVIHGPASGNGWARPGEVLYLSRRTRFILRVPRHRIEDARSLTGATLDVTGHAVRIGQAATKRLSPLATLYARHVTGEPDESEPRFNNRIASSLNEIGVQARKLLCGKEHRIRVPGGFLPMRSMMLADLDAAESIRLQRIGLGPGRKMGCGIFIPHKSIAAVASSLDQPPTRQFRTNAPMTGDSYSS